MRHPLCKLAHELGVASWTLKTPESLPLLPQALLHTNMSVGLSTGVGMKLKHTLSLMRHPVYNLAHKPGVACWPLDTAESLPL